MDRAPAGFVILAALSSLICVWFAAYGQLRRRTPAAFEFSLFALASAIYAGGYCLELQGRSIEDIRAILSVEYVGIVAIPSLWVFFARRFSHDLPPRPLLSVVLIVVPLLVLAMQATNESHHLFYSSTFLRPGAPWPVWDGVRGPGSIFFSFVWGQLAFIGGFAIILRRAFRLRGRARLQAVLIAGAITLPWLANGAYLLRIVPAGLDPAPIAMSAAGCVLGLSLFRIGFLELVPAARDLAIDGLNDGFLVFDGEGHLADSNRAACAFLGKAPLGEPLPPTLTGAAAMMELILAGEGYCGFSVPSVSGGEVRLEAFAFPVLDGRGRRKGVAMTIRDVTESSALLARLADQASLDPLTSVLNRRRFQEAAIRDFGLALRAGRDISVIILDLDHFKAVNDAHGHAAGDEVLRVTTKRLQPGLRFSDLLARYGGEEFALLLPDTSGDGALRVAERLRLQVAGEPVEFAGTQIPVTASFGVFGSVPQASDNLELFLSRADEALYVAKGEGRNTVRLWREGAIAELRKREES